ncbi:MAG: FAD binding domain-containing protein [Beijerinckiaceae bacterium]|jgi:xanthine dehydrogenase small subunit|nr:FAD binding domain-containing protein [Beijerinckiaceae bacterium]
MRYDRPTDLAEALAIRAERRVVLMAGGTDIYPAFAQRKAWGDASRADILDLSALPGLDAITEDEASWRIGSMVTWAALADAPLPALFDGLKEASRHVGGQQVQNRGTLAGNLCTASPAGDGIPNLMALDAEVELSSQAGRRLLPVADFLTGYRQVALRPDEIVTALVVPKGPPARAAFVKLGARHSLVISIAMVAAIVELDAQDRIAAARIAIGACSPVALRLPGLEAALAGERLATAPRRVEAAHLAHLVPISDVRASAEYRREVALHLVRDALTRIHQETARRAA